MDRILGLKVSKKQSKLQQEESIVEILEVPPPTTVKDKPNTAFNSFNTRITWAEENGISAKEIVTIRNMREEKRKKIKQQVAQKQTPIKNYIFEMLQFL